jgi:chromosome segregation ATPase
VDAQSTIETTNYILGLGAFFILGIGGFVLKLQAMRKHDLEKIWDELNATKDAAHKLEVMVLRDLLDAKTVNDAHISAMRAEAKGDLKETIGEMKSRFERLENRMMTQDDGAHHFSTIESMVGNLTKTLDALSGKMETISSALSQFDKRLNTVEVSVEAAKMNINATSG